MFTVTGSLRARVSSRFYSAVPPCDGCDSGDGCDCCGGCLHAADVPLFLLSIAMCSFGRNLVEISASTQFFQSTIMYCTSSSDPRPALLETASWSNATPTSYPQSHATISLPGVAQASASVQCVDYLALALAHNSKHTNYHIMVHNMTDDASMPFSPSSNVRLEHLVSAANTRLERCSLPSLAPRGNSLTRSRS